MPVLQDIVVAIRSDGDIVAARQQGRALAAAIGFTPVTRPVSCRFAPEKRSEATNRPEAELAPTAPNEDRPDRPPPSIPCGTSLDSLPRSPQAVAMPRPPAEDRSELKVGSSASDR